MEVTLPGMVTVVRPVQLKNASTGMERTLLGIVKSAIASGIE